VNVKRNNPISIPLSNLFAFTLIRLFQSL